MTDLFDGSIVLSATKTELNDETYLNVISVILTNREKNDFLLYVNDRSIMTYRVFWRIVTLTIRSVR
jgi:hypothetical protein